MEKYFKNYIVVNILSSLAFLSLILILGREGYSYLKLITAVFVAFQILLAFYLAFSVRQAILKEWKRKCDFLDSVILNRENVKFDIYEDTIFSKEQNKIKNLVRVLNNERNEYEKEKENIKSLVSDISHQIKTPLSNILMYNSTLLERELDTNRQKEFLTYMNGQILKLQWLVDSLIKISRLENDIISLNKDYFKVEDTLALALGSVYLMAEEKKITMDVNVSSEIIAYHDKKWTAEALFNVLENSVKYTKEGGHINIEVDKWESFTRIKIEDNGIGIEENEINEIFKRFYRGKKVAQEMGAGIGLYLAREIIGKQGGYITVKSKVDMGTSFSVFLLNNE